MNDSTTTISELRENIRAFVAERDWEQFHSPKNLAMALAVEAAELMEHFQWIDIAESRQVAEDPTKLAAIGEELADVLSYTLALANSLGIDVASTHRDKMIKNVAKYPAEKFHGHFGSKGA
jgi:NTP pyrophosphatase (non-canonical NTP hydrolase)